MGFVQDFRDPAVCVRAENSVLRCGGLVAHSSDARYGFLRTMELLGFFGTSIIKPSPARPAIKGNMKEFKRLKLRLE